MYTTPCFLLARGVVTATETVTVQQHSGGKFDAPWDTADVEWMVDQLWPELERFVNGPEPRISRLRTPYVECREWLQEIIEGRPPLDDWFSIDVPLALEFRGEGGAVHWGIVRARADDIESLSKELLFTVALLWHPSVRDRLRRCDQCQRFYRAKGRYVRKRSFCTNKCRFDFRNANVGRETRAEYMRKYRRNPRVKSKRQKRRRNDRVRQK